MRLLTLLVSVFHVVHMESLKKVSGYIGESVILASGATQGFSRVEWSIYTNTTWIATLQSGIVNTERHYLFQKRLHLNTTTGDLTISNLTLKDALLYTAEFLYSDEESTKKIKLEVKQRLQAPTIQKMGISATQKGCFIALKCSSSEKDVNFSWQVSSPSMNSWSTKNGSSYIFLLTDSNQDLKFICNSTKGEEAAHQVFSAKCNVFTEKCSTCSWHRFVILFPIGMVVGLIASVLICFCERQTSSV